MAEKRKLLAEVEKVFRKVDEGCDEFVAIQKKMAEASSDNQRDKLQDELKKEIKKLQRLRDQIKGWQNCNDIKDKEQLTKYRKIIETARSYFGVSSEKLYACAENGTVQRHRAREQDETALEAGPSHRGQNRSQGQGEIRCT